VSTGATDLGSADVIVTAPDQPAVSLSQRGRVARPALLRRRVPGILAAAGGALALIALAASPASADGTGQEQITSPANFFTPAVDANGNPIAAGVAVEGTGYTPGANMYAMICDGENPTTVGWSPQDDCDLATQTQAAVVSSAGTVDFASSVSGLTIDVFRGVSPSADFNCLAPIDNPNGSAATVTNAADQADVARINPNVPSWGGDRRAAQSQPGRAPRRRRRSRLQSEPWRARDG
jgi:hypothetical protein